MLPEDETFVQVLLAGRPVRAAARDAARYPDTMDQRYGAWAQLLALFRIVYDGARTATRDAAAPRGSVRPGPLSVPGRAHGGGRTQTHERIEPPLVPDGTVYRVLEKLLVLDGERISYRALDVEQIGSVYETMMGFRLELATRPLGRDQGPEAARRADDGRPRGAARRRSAASAASGSGPCGPQAALAKARRGRQGRRHARGSARRARGRWSTRAATPDLVPPGRWCCSRATSAAGPARTTRRGRSPSRSSAPRSSRSSRRCAARTAGRHARADPRAEGLRPGDGLRRVPGRSVPPARRRAGGGLGRHGESARDPARRGRGHLARRLIAQRCLYGVDRNPWRSTSRRCRSGSRRSHASTRSRSSTTRCATATRSSAFRCGRSKRSTGSRRRRRFAAIRIGQHVEQVTELRRQIREADEQMSDWSCATCGTRRSTSSARCGCSATSRSPRSSSATKPRSREAKRAEFADAVTNGTADQYAAVARRALREPDTPLVPFHWRDRVPGGVLSAPTPGLTRSLATRRSWKDEPDLGATLWPQLPGLAHVGAMRTADGNADLVAHFFRRGFRPCCVIADASDLSRPTPSRRETRRELGSRWICQPRRRHLFRSAPASSGRAWRRSSSALFMSQRVGRQEPLLWMAGR